VSEESTKDDRDCIAESRTARNRPVFRLQMQLRRCHSTQEQYNSVKSDPKKEIPVKEVAEAKRQNVARVCVPDRRSNSDRLPSEAIRPRQPF